MHRLTNNEADRLAVELDNAARRLHELANEHAKRGSAMHILGDTRLGEYHEREHRDVIALEAIIRAHAADLRARNPLWHNGTRIPKERARGYRRRAG